MMNDVITQKLVHELNEGNKSAFEKIYNFYKRRLYLYLYKLVKSRPEAEDIVSKVFIKLWEEKNRNQIASQTHLERWLFTSGFNFFIDLKRYNRRYLPPVELQEELIDSLNEEIKDLEKEIELIHTIDAIYNAIESLPEGRRKIFKLRYIDQMRVMDIADKLGLKLQTVSNQLARAKDQVREFLQKV